MIWVRSDSKNKVRPCDEFVRLKSKKYCTQCNVTGFLRQPLEFFSNVDWMDTAATQCVCILRSR